MLASCVIDISFQLWKQTSTGNTHAFSGESWHKDVKGKWYRECNQLKKGGNGHVEEKECDGNNAIAVCGGKSVNFITRIERDTPNMKISISRHTHLEAIMGKIQFNKNQVFKVY